MNIQIDPIHTSELKELVAIAIQTFAETFADTNTPENMEDYYSRCFTVEQFNKEFQIDESWFYFARAEGKIAGFLKINVGTSQTELHEEEGFEVERIYVLEEFYGCGVGKELMEYAIDRGKELGKKYLWLGVHEKNYRALRFYEKFGLEAFSDHVFMMGKEPQRDLLLKMSLT